MILTIRTDKPEAEVGLYEGEQQKAYKKWQAHRELGLTIHIVIKELLDKEYIGWSDIKGVIYFKGPGSFTGLRIGASVANALAVSNNIPVASQDGEEWIENGIKSLSKNQETAALPEYGSEPHVTAQKK